MPSHRIIHSDPLMRLATWQNVAVTDLAGEMTLVGMQRLSRMCRELKGSYPSGIVTLALMRHATTVAPPAVREEAGRMLRDLGDGITRMAIVIEADGIMAQVLRTVVRGMSVVARSMKLVQFNSVDDAITGLLPFVVAPEGDRTPRASFAAALEEIRSDFGPAKAPRAAERR